MSDTITTQAVSPDDTPRRRPSLLATVAATAALGTLSSIAVASVAFADRGHDWGYRDGRHWWGVGSLLLFLAVIAATAALTALLVGRRQATAGPGAPPPPAPPVPPSAAFGGPASPLAGAETILAERLARGEISPDDYRASAAALRGETPAPPPSEPSA